MKKNMKQALKIMSWIAVILGILTILGGFSEPSGTGASEAFLGGLLFGVEGLLALLYIRQTEK